MPTELNVYRGQLGWGVFGGRQYGRTYPYTIRIRTLPETSLPTISISSSSGAFAGIIRTDVGRPIVADLEFSRVKGDMREFTLRLIKLPSFPIPPFSYLTIKFSDSTNSVYRGKVTEAPEEDDKGEKTFDFRGIGLSDEFQQLTPDNKDYAALSDYGEIVDDIAQNIIAANTKINYNPDKVTTDTGIVTAQILNFGKSNVRKALDTLCQGSGYECGVDAEGDFFFLERNDEVVKTYFLGNNLHKFQPKQNVNTIRNSIIGQRQEGKGSGAAGWIVADEVSDTKSIRKYGKREERYQLPGYFSDADITAIITRRLSELKDPQLSATGLTFIFRGYRDILLRGQSKIIMPFEQYTAIYETCDDAATDFVKIGLGDLEIENDGVNFVAGQNSMRLSWGTGGAIGDRAEIDTEFKGVLQKVRFWYYGSKQGTLARVGIAFDSGTEYTKDITVNAAATERFILYSWDVSAFLIRKINRLWFEILDTGSGELNIDEIQFVAKGNKHYTLTNDKQTYKISPTENSISFEWGVVPAKLDNFIAALLAQSEESRAMGEIR